jgi:Uncharacterized protein conserved in bacteria (DUF2066)
MGRHRWQAAAIQLAILVYVTGAATGATVAASGDAYAVTVPATGRTPDELKPAYLEALRRIIVALTGREEAGRDAALLARFGDPATYVQRYQADGAGLRVQFDPVLTRRVLVASGYLAAAPDESAPQAGNAIPVQLVVANINRADDYGAVLQIIHALEISGAVSVQGATGSNVTFAVSMRGGPEAVSKALANLAATHSSMQAESATTDPTGSAGAASGVLHYRYAPGL